MKHNIGDRWINYIIRRVQVNNDPFSEKIWFVLGIGKLILFMLGVFTGDNNILLLYSALFFLFAGIVHFERRRFVNIIRTQSQEIQHLQAQLAETEK
jgi:hypothetical protein